ncbi:unnamed protein product [Nippostrongylus brasiliensis]|uniref:Vacuolar ATPase assembly protein VMA22 n=1 Tax=Nippostrongylus brasiliensis TaxID=27835 RepID=A0A0N4XYQ0_NIPBR|nr:unnamed protein product [Nippostrongylus brasiliensis]
MEKLNSIALERLRLISEYCKLATQLESFLDSARSNISRARTLQGIALSSIFNIETLELEPTTRFSLIDGEETKSEEAETNTVRRRKDDPVLRKDDKEEPQKPKSMPNFRPFGLFEPLSAKEARHSMHSALELVCELANLQSEIKSIDAQMATIKKVLQDDSKLCQKFLEVL